MNKTMNKYKTPYASNKDVERLAETCGITLSYARRIIRYGEKDLKYLKEWIKIKRKLIKE